MNEHLRLKALRRILKLSQGALAKVIDRRQGSVSDIERGRNSVDGIIPLLRMAFGVNPVWLKTGEGEMFLPGAVTQGAAVYNADRLLRSAPAAAMPGSTTSGSALTGLTTSGSALTGLTTPGSATPGSAAPGSVAPGSATPGSATPGSAAPGTSQQTGVPYFNIELHEQTTGGAGAAFPLVNEPPEYYIDCKPFNDCTAYFPYHGDSMYPKYLHGDIIAVKEIRNFDIILWGEAYLVITDEQANGLKAIRLVIKHKDKTKVILRALNPAFSGDTVINKKSIVSLHLVKGKITVTV